MFTNTPESRPARSGPGFRGRQSCGSVLVLRVSSAVKVSRPAVMPADGRFPALRPGPRTRNRGRSRVTMAPRPPAPAPPRPMTRSPARLRGARMPPADSKPQPEPRYHDRAARRAIHCPGSHLPGRGHQARGGHAGDPAGVPFRQLIRIPSGVPADTGNPCPPPSRRHRPIRTFRQTPRLIQHQACKTISGGVRPIIRSVNGGS